MKAVVGINERGMRVGQWHHRAKLTDAEVDQMLALRDTGWGYKRLAKAFDISVRHVRDILAGKKRQLATAFREVRLPAG